MKKRELHTLYTAAAQRAAQRKGRKESHHSQQRGRNQASAGLHKQTGCQDPECQGRNPRIRNYISGSEVFPSAGIGEGKG